MKLRLPWYGSALASSATFYVLTWAIVFVWPEGAWPTQTANPFGGWLIIWPAMGIALVLVSVEALLLSKSRKVLCLTVTWLLISVVAAKFII